VCSVSEAGDSLEDALGSKDGSLVSGFDKEGKAKFFLKVSNEMISK
jgi:hypothetical protein